MRTHLNKALRRLNFVRVVCGHLFGDRHTPRHRMGVGAVVMVVGVTVAKAGSDIHILVLHYVADILGYFIHGVGAVPFIEHMLDDAKHAEATKADLELPPIEFADSVGEELI